MRHGICKAMGGARGWKMKHRSMAVGTSTLGLSRRAIRGRSRRPDRGETPPAVRRTNLVLTAWLVTAAGAFLGLMPDDEGQIERLAIGLLALMIAGNLILWQLSPETIVRPWCSTLVAIAYSLLLLGLWDLGQQTAIPLLVGSIAVFDLAVVGLSLGEILAVALAMAGIYLIIL